jgi:hypothetical protein
MFGRLTKPLLVLIAVAGAIVLAVVTRSAAPPAGPEPGPTSEVPPPPGFGPTRYLNAEPGVAYIGSAACAGCHPDNHKSYQLTAHSRAFADVDPAVEPPDGTFDHKASGRSYRVYRKDGQLRHEEVVRDDRGTEVARVDLPVRYLVGSGHFCRTYLIEQDGEFAESPITYYTSRKAWDLSPGYDAEQHFGFERPIITRCLGCHAGRVEPGPTAQHPVLHEKAIGCESCHGPGALHAELHRGKKSAGGEDLTIVHPGRLPRELSEAVCAECHLGAPAAVHHRGRQSTDFRPGRPATDFRTEYRLAAPEEQMTVVGHVEQLRQSACYNGSPDLTCITCHDPHARERPADMTAYYRARCLDCHQTHPCSVPEPDRRKSQPADNCAACHMPRGDTDIPHVAFTHHRIGKHPARPAPQPDRVPELVAASDVSGLSPADRERGLGLAYAEAAGKPLYDRHAAALWERARPHLDAAYAAGLRDANTLAALAECYRALDPARAADFARQALATPGVTAEIKAGALRVLAEVEVMARNYAAAAAELEELVRLRRTADDWRLLGMCYLSLNQPQKGLGPLQKALEIRPYRPANQLGMSEAFRLLGDSRRAAEYRDRAKWFADHHQD